MFYRVLSILLAAVFCLSIPAGGQNIKRSVVKIIKDNDQYEVGSGIIVGQSGRKLFVLTAYHVVEEARTLQVYFYESANLGSGHAAGPPVRVDKEQDIAVLVVDFFPSFPTMELAKLVKPKSDKLKADRTVSCIGHPHGNEWFYQKFNTVSDPKNTPLTFAFTSVGIEKGYSGGPVFYGTGNRLAGMITDVGSSGGVAVRTDVLLAYLTKWRIPTNLLRSSVKTGTYILGGISIAAAGTGYFKFNKDVKDWNTVAEDFRNPEALMRQHQLTRDQLQSKGEGAESTRDLLYIGSALSALGAIAIEIDWNKLFGKEPEFTMPTDGSLRREDLFGARLLIKGDGQVGIKITF